MKKKLLIALLTLIPLCNVFSQDTIFAKNGKKIIVDIIEVTPEKIVGQLPNRPDIRYMLRPNEVMRIHYGNGTQVEYSDQAWKEEKEEILPKQFTPKGRRQIGFEFMNPAYGIRFENRIGKSPLYFTSLITINSGFGAFSWQSDLVNASTYYYNTVDDQYYVNIHETRSNFEEYNHVLEPMALYQITRYNKREYSYETSNLFNSALIPNAFSIVDNEAFSPVFHLPFSHVNQVSTFGNRFDVGLNFQLRNDYRKLQPFIHTSIGVGGVTYFGESNIRVNYSYSDSLSTGENRDIYTYSNEKPQRSTIALYTSLGLGLKYHISDKYSLSLSVVRTDAQFKMQDQSVTIFYKDGQSETIDLPNPATKSNRLFIPVTISINL